jgi:hypothetical protein
MGRMIGVSKKTAWFLFHRIRESLRETNPGMLGGEGKTVEIDESFVGGLEKNKHRRKRKHEGTFDGSDLLSLDGKVNRADGRPLRICIPTPAPTPPDLFTGTS